MKEKCGEGWLVLIKTEPKKKFQTYGGWDRIHATKTEAQASAKRAKKFWHSAKVVKVRACVK